MRVSAAGNMPLQGLVKPPAKPVVLISCSKTMKIVEKSIYKMPKMVYNKCVGWENH